MMRFIYGFDGLDDVKQILLDCRTAKQVGRVVEWTSQNVSVKKVGSSKDLDEIIRAAEQFIRTWDPDIRQNNPIIRRTKPVLYL
jgi:hypothetical protein